MYHHVNKSGPSLGLKFQVKNHVQTACESHDLNMDFCCFKQLGTANSMQEHIIDPVKCICTTRNID